MQETLKGKLVILPPRIDVYPNHTPKNQMRLRRWTPLVICKDAPREGDLILGNKRDGYPIIVFSAERPYKNGKKILAMWDNFSSKVFDKIEKGELQGDVMLLAEAGQPLKDERGYVTFMKLAIQKLC